MKLSTELALTNLVLLGVLFYCAFNGFFLTWAFVLTAMLFFRIASGRARAIELLHDREKKAKEMIARGFKDRP